MNFRCEIGVVKAIRRRAIVVAADPGKDVPAACSACGEKGGCGGCAGRAGVVNVTVRVDDPVAYTIGDTVELRMAQVPFSLSITLIFILPLVLMTALPGLGVILARQGGPQFLAGGPAIALLAFSGVALAFALNFLVDRAINQRWPTTVKKCAGASDKD